MISLFALLLGFCLDLLFGDPHWLWHPVRVIGFVIVKSEQFLREIFRQDERGERRAGMCCVLLVISMSVCVPLLILYVAERINPILRFIIESVMCYQLLALKSLKTESMKVYSALQDGNIDSARHALSMIVGRDTDKLNEEGIAKAAVETVAENTSDGIIAPMLFMAVFGAGGGFFYKAVNTMDSMIGYKNEKYLNFGRYAAKLDDFLNYIPARISAYLMIVSAWIGSMHWKDAYRIYKRDRYNHSSPNSAHTESVCAGALGIRLGGDTYYFGKLHKKPTIGDNSRQTVTDDIKRANWLLYMTACLGMFLFIGIRYLTYYLMI